MTSLQQVVQGHICDDSDVIVFAMHRRSLTLLVGNSTTLITTRQDTNGKWVFYNAWNLPSETSRIIGYFPVEAYSCFIIFVEVKHVAVIIFLDLSGNLLNSWPISGVLDVSAADIDQNRRELIVATNKNDMCSIAIRGVVHEHVKGVVDLTDATVLFEALVRLKAHLYPKSTSPPTMLACFDLQGLFMTLNGNGQVMGFETASLDIIWTLEPTNFLYKPSYIVVNKFGPGFFIYSHSQVNHVSRLEYWTPPETSVACSSGTFSRTVVPLSAPLSGISIESVGSKIGTYAVVVQADRQVFLWKVVSKNKITLDAKITLTNGNASIFERKTLDRAINWQTKYDNLKAKSNKKWTLKCLKHYLPGIISFSAGSGIPDSPMTIIITIANIFCFISMHVPLMSDLDWLGYSHSALRAGIADAEMRLQDMKTTNLSLNETNFGLTGSSAPKTASKPFQKQMEDEDIEIVLQSGVGAEGEVIENSRPRRPPTPEESAHNIGGKLAMFSPLGLLDSATLAANRRSLAMEPKEGAVGLILPTSALITTSLVQRGKSSIVQSDLQLIQRGGLYAPTRVEDEEATKSLDVLMGCVIYRTRKLVVLTNLKELFWMPLPPLPIENVRLSQHKKPVKIGVDIRATHVRVTCLTAGDVFLKLPSDKLATDSLSSPIISGGIVGSWAITLAGDSAGSVHFYVTSDEGILQQGSFVAYSSTTPIVSILMTGDSMRPMWRVGTSASTLKEVEDPGKLGSLQKLKISSGRTGSSNAQLRCVPIPGSAIVTVGKDGEVKIWQPVFTQMPRSKANTSQLLSIFEISWRLSGIFSGLGNPSLYVSSACLDPTCMTILLSTSNGFILQWPLAGLVETNSGSLASTRESVYSCKRHDTSISTMRVWIDSPNTSIQEVSGVSTGSKLGALSRGPLSGTVGYTVPQLNYLTGNSTLVTSSTDSSIVLWRFTLSKIMQGADVNSSNQRFLNPTPCKRLFFSTIPRDGICFPVLGPQGSALSSNISVTGSTLTWKVSVLLNGVVITAAQAPYYNLLDVAGFSGEETGATKESNIELDDEDALDDAFESKLAGEGVDKFNDHTGDTDGSMKSPTLGGKLTEGIVLSLMPAVANVVKPNRLAVLTPQRVAEGVNSWTLLNRDWLDRKAEIQENTRLETSLLGVGEMATKPKDTHKLVETLLKSRPTSANDKTLRSRSKSPSHSRSATILALPDHKVDIGVEEEMTVMRGSRSPTGDLNSQVPIRDDGLVSTLRSGYRVLVTPDQEGNISTVIPQSTKENNRMVYISPEKRMEERIRPDFEPEISLFSSLNTPFINSGSPQPLSPKASLSIEQSLSLALDVPQLVVRSQSQDRVVSVSSPSRPRHHSMPTVSTKAVLHDPPIDLESPAHSGSSPMKHVFDDNSSHGSTESKLKAAIFGKKFSSNTSENPLHSSNGVVKDDRIDALSIDSEFDPTYIDATMSVMSSSTVKPFSTTGVASGKVGISGSSSVIDLQSNSDKVQIPPPVTPSKAIINDQSSPGKANISILLPLDDEAPVVEVEAVMIRDDGSEVSDLEIAGELLGQQSKRNRAVNTEKERAKKIKYVSKTRVSGPVVKGKVVLQPYVTPKIGFIPSRNFYERKMEEGKSRVVVNKPKANSNTETLSFGNLQHQPSRTTIGLVEDGDKGLILGATTEMKQHDHYFDWSSDPLFVLRGPMLPIDPIGDTGFDMLSNFPDDHEIFAHAPKEISEDEVIEDLDQIEKSKFKRMGDEEKAEFMREKREAHEREVEASKHFFREMLSESVKQESAGGNVTKRNALQKTTLSVMHLMRWGVVKRVLDEGAMSHDDLEGMLKEAMEEERKELTTAEKDGQMLRQSESFHSAKTLDPENYSDTESESQPSQVSLVASVAKSKQATKDYAENMQDSYELDELEEKDEDEFDHFDIQRIPNMDGALTRPVTSENNIELLRPDSITTNASRPQSRGVSSSHSPKRVLQSPSTERRPFSRAGAVLDVEAAKKLVANEGGRIVQEVDGSVVFVSKMGEKYVKQPNTTFFVKASAQSSPVMNVREYVPYTVTGSPEEFISAFSTGGTPGITPGSSGRGAMVNRSVRDKLIKTPVRRKPMKKNKSFHDDSDDDSDVENTVLEVFKGKSEKSKFQKSPSKSRSFDMTRSESVADLSENENTEKASPKNKMKNLVKSSLMKMEVKHAMGGLVLPAVIPPPGEITFLGFSKFLKAVNAKVAESKKPPQVKADIVRTSHDSVAVSLRTTKPCSVWVVAINWASSYIPHNHEFDDINAMKAIPDVVAVEAAVIEDDDLEYEAEVVLKELKPEKKYKIFYCADISIKPKSKFGGKRSSGDLFESRTPDIVIEDSMLNVKTSPEPPEYLDIEWGLLSEKDQEMEVRAASRSMSVQASSKLNNISIPTDEDIANRKKPAQIPAMKKWTNFVNWWTNDDPILGFSAARIEFQSDEILFIVRDSTIRNACFERGYLSVSELNHLNAFLYDMEEVFDRLEGPDLVAVEDYPQKDDIDPVIFDDPVFHIFRSWYKGGRVVQRLQFFDSLGGQLMRANRNKAETDDDTENMSIDDSLAEGDLNGLVMADIPYDVEQGLKASEFQRLKRTEILYGRIAYVESQKLAAMKLLDQHKYVESKSLRYADLQTKRNTLSPQDIDAIMASRKLAEVCRAADVELFRLPGQFMQRVAKADIFRDSPKKYLVPDFPPPMVKGSGAEGGLVPVKAWSVCTDLEKELECRIACMLDSIAELAVKSGVHVPSIEDADLDETLVPVKASKWKKFTEWYVGSEKNSVGGENFINFSNARLEFSKWERKAASSNFLIHLKIRGKPPTVLGGDCFPPPSAICNADDDMSSVATVATETTLDSQSVVTREASIDMANMTEEEKIARIQREREVLTDSYIDIVNTQSGAEMRVDLFLEYINSLNSSRYASSMRCMWPSAPPRQSLQFMFPRLGLITPFPEPHTLHMKLYASRKKDGYTVKDIMKFFSIEELNDDDIKFQKAEEKGKKFEEYIVWLSKEKDRVAEGRNKMVEEDIHAHKFRIMQETLARKLFPPRGNPHYENYALTTSLPGGNYSELASETVLFSNGNGSLNEDEIFDIKDDMIRRAREGYQALREKKRIAIEEQKKAEELERIRLEKREREKRIQEGVVRRENIRNKLLLLKEERDLKLMIARRDKLLEEQEEKRRLAEELAEQMAEQMRLDEIRNSERELLEMNREEIVQRNRENLEKNRTGMAVEDALSHLREELDAYADDILAQRRKDLKELYTAHVPFVFKKRRTEISWLNNDEKVEFYGRIEPLSSPVGPRFSPDLKKRVPQRTVLQGENGSTIYPATESVKYHVSRSENHIRQPNITSKTSRFDSPPRFSGPLAVSKSVTVFSSTTPIPQQRDPFRITTPDKDTGYTANPEALSTDIRRASQRRQEFIQLSSPFLPVISSKSTPIIQQAPVVSGCESTVSLPGIDSVKASLTGNSEVNDQRETRTKKLSVPNDLKYVISRDIAGLQNRKKLLRASLSGLDWKKEYIKAPRARVSEHIHRSSERVVDRIKREREAVSSYLSEPVEDMEVLEDKFYLMACQPGIRDHDSVNASEKEKVKKFRESLFSNIEEYVEGDLKLNEDMNNQGTKDIDDESTSGPLADFRSRAQISIVDESRKAVSTKGSSRPTTGVFPMEPEWPIGLLDYRQVNVPPPFYRETFGVLGEKKNIVQDPKVIQKHNEYQEVLKTNNTKSKRVTAGK